MKIKIKGTFNSTELYDIVSILKQAETDAKREEEEEELEKLSENPEELINRIVREANAVQMISMYGEHSDWVLKALEYVPIEELKTNPVFERFQGVYSTKINFLIENGENSKRTQNTHESEEYTFNCKSKNGVELNIDQECNSRQISEIITALRDSADKIKFILAEKLEIALNKNPEEPEDVTL